MFATPTQKLLKWDLVQTLNTFRKPFLLIFAAGKPSLLSFVFGQDSIFVCFNLHPYHDH